MPAQQYSTGPAPVMRSAATKVPSAATPPVTPQPASGLPLPTPGGSAQPAVTPAAAQRVVSAPDMGNAGGMLHAFEGAPVSNQQAGFDQGKWASLAPDEQARYQAAGGAPNLQAGGASNLTPIDPANSLTGQQINYDVPAASVDFGGINVSAPSVAQAGKEAYQSYLPLLDSNLAIQGDQLAKHTSALGRTGSGLFNRATGSIYDQAKQQGQALAGQYAYGAAGQDAGNALQASMANAGNMVQGRLFNANGAQQAGLQRIGLQQQQQQRQDALSQQGFDNALAQLGLFGGAFGGNPSATDLGAAGSYGNIADLFGSNASQTGDQIAAAGESGAPAGMDWVSQLLNGAPTETKAPAAPAARPQIQVPRAQMQQVTLQPNRYVDPYNENGPGD